VTENSKEENSEDFCPIYVQEFVLCPQNIVKYINKTDANHRICWGGEGEGAEGFRRL
jgi:hypothetical protein